MENPLLEAAQRKLGPLPAWQWGAVIGGGAIALRLILPPKGSGSFFRRADTSGTNEVQAAAGSSGLDRRPVAPFAGLEPGLGPQTAFAVPGLSPAQSFLSVTTPGGVSISGEGITPKDITSILSTIFQPKGSATPKQPAPRRSPKKPSTAKTPTGRTPVPTPSAKVAPKPRKAVTKTNTYTVRKGDTLWRISSRVCGSGAKWPNILAQNPSAVSRPGDPGTLRIGYTLRWNC